MKFLVLYSVLYFFVIASGYSQRAAFIVGISNYRPMGPLVNSSKDADSIKNVLHSFGYETFVIKDASYSEVMNSFEKWFPLMRKYKDVVIYFSGHGFMVGSNNEFMALNDFDPKNFINVENRALQKYYLLKKLAELATAPTEKPIHKVIIIEACRDFPTKKQLVEAIDKSNLTLHEPRLSNYMIYYTIEAGGQTYNDGPNNSVGTAALLKHLHTNRYDNWDKFLNDLNSLLYDDSTKDVAFKVDGSPFPWRFVDTTCQVCYSPEVSIASICNTCLPDRVTAPLIDLFNLDLETIRRLSDGTALRRIRPGRDNSEIYAAAYIQSPVEERLDRFFKKFEISPASYDAGNSFVIYEFAKKKLANLQVYLKYTDRSLHKGLAKALNVDLNQFPGFCYLTSYRGSLPDGMAPLDDTNPVVLGRVIEYGYSVLEFGPYQELFDDSKTLDKYIRTLTAADKQKLAFFR